MIKLQRIAMLMLVTVLIVVAGCSSSSSPKKALQDAMMKMNDVDSYSAQISIGIDELEIPEDASQEQMISTAALASMIKSAKLNVNAVYQKEPLRMDMDLNVVLSGLTITVPMIMTEQKLYIKIPAIPMLNLPVELTEKYVEIDIEALASQQDSAASLDIAAQQKFAQELSLVLLKHFDEKSYFSNVKAEEAGLPEGLEVDQIVRFAIDESNYEKSVEMIVNELLPELIDVLAANEAYLQSTKLTKEEVVKMKSDLETNKADVINTLKNDVKINDLSLTGGIKDKLLEYQAGKLNVAYTEKESGQTMKLGVHYDVQYSEINKAPKFTQDVPTDTIKLEDLAKQLQLPIGL